MTEPHSFRTVLPYIAPFLAFGVVASFENASPMARFIVYPLKVLIVGWILWFFRKKIPAEGSWHVASALGVGFLAFALWVGLDPWLGFRGERAGFDPTMIDHPYRVFVVLFRVAGAVLVFPLMEELFWRGFMMRYIISENFEQVRFGTYTHLSFWVVVAGFAATHGKAEWALAVLVGILYGAYCVKTKSLKSVVLAHAFTNLLLACYVLSRSAWYFW
ncbi:MAG: CAAX prenyl protease-related protein [Verrucomicrobiota bacterium]|nr:CAAX prenyl protease-related protein [Verrucomicrobiota bacterium]